MDTSDAPVVMSLAEALYATFEACASHPVSQEGHPRGLCSVTFDAFELTASQLQVDAMREARWCEVLRCLKWFLVPAATEGAAVPRHITELRMKFDKVVNLFRMTAEGATATLSDFPALTVSEHLPISGHTDEAAEAAIYTAALVGVHASSCVCDSGTDCMPGMQVASIALRYGIAVMQEVMQYMPDPRPVYYIFHPTPRDDSWPEVTTQPLPDMVFLLCV